MYKSCKGRSDQFHSQTEKDLLANFLSHLKFLQPDCTFEWYHAASSFQRHNRTASLCDTCHLVSVRHIRQLKVKFIVHVSDFFDQEWPFKRFSSKMNGHGPWIMSMKLEGPNNWKVDDLTWRIFGLKWSANESKRPRNLKWLTPTWPPKMGLTVCFRS